MNCKKLLSGLLVGALCLSTIPASVFAAGEEADAPEGPVTGDITEENPIKTTEDGFQYYVNEAGKITINGYNGYEATINIPATIEDKDVSTIAYSAFANKPWITAVTVPETVGAIEDNAFRGCVSLSSLTLPKGLTHIGPYAFSHCALADTSAFEGLTALETPELDLNDNVLTDISGLAGLNVAIVDLSGNPELTDISALYQMSALIRADLTGTGVTGAAVWESTAYADETLPSTVVGSEKDLTLSPAILFDGTTIDSDVVYTSDNEKVAVVEGQTLKYTGAGTAAITATYKEDAKTAKTFKVTIGASEGTIKDIQEGVRNELAIGDTTLAVILPEGFFTDYPELKGSDLVVKSIADRAAVEEAIKNDKALGEKYELFQLFDFSFVKDGKALPFEAKENGKKVAVSFTLTPEQIEKYIDFGCFFVDGKALSTVDGLSVKDGYASIDLGHFSTYAFVGKTGDMPGPVPTPTPAPSDNNGKTGNNGASSNVNTGVVTDPATAAFLSSGMLILAVAGLIALRKRSFF